MKHFMGKHAGPNARAYTNKDKIYSSLKNREAVNHDTSKYVQENAHTDGGSFSGHW